MCRTDLRATGQEQGTGFSSWYREVPAEMGDYEVREKGMEFREE